MKRTIALGFFDGVHIGHAALLEKTKERAEQIDAQPSVLSFDVHPDNLIHNTVVPLISDTQGREEVIRRCFGIDDVIFIHFSRYVMQMPWRDFLDNIVNELDVAWIVCGYDFTFGSMGEGNAQKLSEYCAEMGIGVDVMPEIKLDGITVSSTYIRKLLEEGDVETAARFLGHPHCLSDIVHSGYHIGAKLDAPTINMFFPDGVIVPRRGVYATKVILSDGSEYRAVTNVGVRPTFSDENKVSVESHLLNFSGNLYNAPARVDFYKFLRPERKFTDIDELSRQIKKDSKAAEEYFELCSC